MLGLLFTCLCFLKTSLFVWHVSDFKLFAITTLARVYSACFVSIQAIRKIDQVKELLTKYCFSRVWMLHPASSVQTLSYICLYSNKMIWNSSLFCTNEHQKMPTIQTKRYLPLEVKKHRKESKSSGRKSMHQSATNWSWPSKPFIAWLFVWLAKP